MAFEFRFQRVLEVRQLEEQQEQARLAEIQAELEREQERLSSLRDSLQATFQKTRQSQRSGAQGLDLNLLRQFHRSSRALQKNIQEQAGVVETLEERLEAQRRRLVEASQRREIFETLKEQKLEEFVEEQKRTEQQRLNDVATRQFYRRGQKDA